LATTAAWLRRLGKLAATLPVPPAGPRHWLNLFGRADKGVPPCSAAWFAKLAAWLDVHGDGLPTTGGWVKELEVGGGR
jgi:hypothetical protein